MVVLGLLVAAVVLEVKWANSTLTGIHVFRQTGSGWQQLPVSKGFPDALRISATGTVWTLSMDGLNRWDGTAWRHFNGKDFGSRTYMGGTFVLDGEQLLAPIREGVLNWDGENWQVHDKVLTDPGASIVAGGGEVWMIDRSGKLFHYKGGEWENRIWKDHPSSGHPQLARAADGALWAVWNGIWRFDGAAWAPAAVGQDSLVHVRLVGATGDRLWFSDSSGLRSVSTDGKKWKVYSPAQTGLVGRHTVYDVASAGGRTWFATDAGAFEFDELHWRQLPLPGGVAEIRSVGAGPDGGVWVIGMPPMGVLRTFVFPLTLLTGVAILGVIIWVFKRFRRRRLEQHRLVAQAVQHATGDVPAELQHGERKLAWFGAATAAEFIGAIAGYAILRRFWPEAPMWTIPVMGVAIYLAVTVLQSLVKREAKPSDPIGPGGPSRYDWGKTWKAVAGVLLLILIFNADRLPMLSFLRGYYFWMLLLVPAAHQALMTSLQNAATRRGDYDGALKIIRYFHFYNPSGVEALRMSGHTLLLAGRYRAAEETLRRSLTSSQARESYGSALEYLGDALGEQGRYDEATRSYEAALHAFSWSRRPYRGMAEMLLRQEKNPQLALEYVERIIDFKGLSWRERQNNGRPQDDYWALKAWALARLGRASEVAPAIENALLATDKKTLPDLATTHYRAGMAMQALDNVSSANEHFKKALELDPLGRRGALAKIALHERSVIASLRV